MAKPFNHILRNYILKISFDLFRRQGFQKTTTREIASAAGIERGLLHHYFSKKQKILFTLYTDFLDSIFDFTLKRYPREEAYQLMAVFNALYYRIIFLREDVIGIFRDILENRDLTRIKIEKTADLYARLLEELDRPAPRAELKLSCMVAIGAEVELVLGMLDGRLSWTRPQLAAQITRLEFMCLPYPQDQINELIGRAASLAEEIDLGLFSEFMAGHCPWFQGVEARPESLPPI